jgi:hypothetical protein
LFKSFYKKINPIGLIQKNQSFGFLSFLDADIQAANEPRRSKDAKQTGSKGEGFAEGG